MKNVLLLCALACTFTAGAQSTDKAAAIKALVESGKYMFRPTTALPVRGQVRQLTSEFEMTVTLPNKIVSDLPYYGRAYTPIDPTKGGMDFVTKDFDYAITPGKKGGWEITIKPKDLKDDIQQMFLSISSEGYATLRVICTNRDAISYNGSVLSPQ